MAGRQILQQMWLGLKEKQQLDFLPERIWWKLQWIGCQMKKSYHSISVPMEEAPMTFQMLFVLFSFINFWFLVGYKCTF